MAAIGAKRNSCVRVPYFGVALQCFRHRTGADLNQWHVIRGQTGSQVTSRKGATELHAFHFLMAWHQRQNTDPRHVWLREAIPITSAASIVRRKTC